MELTRIWRGFWWEFWQALKGGRPQNPTDRVRFNLAVAEEAQHLANRLKSGSPEFNTAVLAEVARILDLDTAVATGLRKAA